LFLPPGLPPFPSTPFLCSEVFLLKLSVWARVLSLFLVLSLAACSTPPVPETSDDTLQIVATVFPAYDFARTIGGDAAQVSLLLPPGTESHSYEPTPADMIAVQNCDLFLYLGGESDAWVDTILESIDFQGTALRLIDCVDLLEEEHVDGMTEMPGHDHDHEHAHDDHAHDHDLGAVKEYDEHVWTSPRNAALITRGIGDVMCRLDVSHRALYEENCAAYAAQLDVLDQTFRDFFSEIPSPTLLFGDRFPLRYFAAEYDLTYYAAFPGCSTQTEPSAATIAFLIDEVLHHELSTVFYIEFSNHLVADSIAEAAGVQTALFHTCHNVSQQEMDAGATYLSLMQQNLSTLQQALSP